MAKFNRNAWWLKSDFWILEDSDNPNKPFALYFWTLDGKGEGKVMQKISEDFDTYEAAKTYWKLTHG